MLYNKTKTAPKIMGVINLTPDSFSDGGKFNTQKKALKQAEKLIQDGADILDLGAEASGPGSINISQEEEAQRLIPILKSLRKIFSTPISIDTYKSEIADIALNEGANIINDITALRADHKMAKVIAKNKGSIILMYAKDATARTTIKKKRYVDVVETISKFLLQQKQVALKAGIPKNKIIIDPGMGHFVSAIPKYSYEIISRLSEFKKIQQPILIGLSRKSMLGGKLETRDDRGLPLTAIAYLNGASIIRTHNVQMTKEFLQNLNQ